MSQTRVNDSKRFLLIVVGQNFNHNFSSVGEKFIKFGIIWWLVVLICWLVMLHAQYLLDNSLNTANELYN